MSSRPTNRIFWFSYNQETCCLQKPIFLRHQSIFYLSYLPPGLKPGDEVLLLNGKPASALQMDDMKAAFVAQALTLSLSTVPELDPQVHCCHPPRRSDWEQDAATDIFSQSQGEAFCCAGKKIVYRLGGNKNVQPETVAE